MATLNPKGDYQIETAGVKLYDMANTTANATTLPRDAQVTVTGTVTLNGKTWYAVTYEGRTGYIESGVSLKQTEATASPEPTSTFVIGTMIPINYEDESKETQTGTVPWGLIGGAIVLVGGAGGVYAYALNQNKRRKAAAARAAAQRRAQAAAGTAAAGTASPYARRAVAAPPVGGAQQRSQTQQPRPTGNPYAPQGGYGTAQQQPNANPYTGSYGSGAQNTPYSYTHAEEQRMSYAPAQESANPYARPSNAASPYAAPIAPVNQQENPAASSNPYARPISAPTYSAQEGTTSGDASRRRTTRMQRYHATEEDSE